MTHIIITLIVAVLFLVIGLQVLYRLGWEWTQVAPTLALMIPVLASIIGYHYAKYQDRLTRRYGALCRLEDELIHTINRVCKIEHVAKGFGEYKDPLVFEHEPPPAISQEILHGLGHLKIKQAVFNIISDLDHLSRMIAFVLANKKAANTGALDSAVTAIQSTASTLISRIVDCQVHVKTALKVDRPPTTLHMPFTSSRRRTALDCHHKQEIEPDIQKLRGGYDEDLERMEKGVKS